VSIRGEAPSDSTVNILQRERHQHVLLARFETRAGIEFARRRVVARDLEVMPGCSPLLPGIVLYRPFRISRGYLGEMTAKAASKQRKRRLAHSCDRLKPMRRTVGLLSRYTFAPISPR
jgi:hypothetical protein